MNFYLTNEHRKYFGLKPIKSNYDLIKLKWLILVVII